MRGFQWIFTVLLAAVMVTCAIRCDKALQDVDNFGGTRLNNPDIIYPEDGARGLDTAITFQWATIKRVNVTYALQIYKTGDSTPVIEIEDIENDTTKDTIQRTVTSFSYAQGYEWKLRARADTNVRSTHKMSFSTAFSQNDTYLLNSTSCRGVALDSSGNLFVYGNGFGMLRYGPSSASFDSVSGDRTFSYVHVAPDNTKWCGVVTDKTPAGTILYTITNDEISLTEPSSPIKKENDMVSGITHNRYGHIVAVATQSVLVIETSQGWVQIEEIMLDGTKRLLADAGVTVVATDPEAQGAYQGIYLGSGNNGFFMLDSLQRTYTLGATDTIEGGQEVSNTETLHHIDTVSRWIDTAFVVDSTGMVSPDTLDTAEVTVSVTGNDTLYQIIDTTTSEVRAEPSSLTMTRLGYIEIESYILFDTTAVDTAYMGHSLRSDVEVVDIAVGNDGDLWCAANNGLLHVGPSDTTLYSSKTNPELITDNMTCCTVASDGAVWVGTEDGYAVFRDGGFIHVKNGYNSALPASGNAIAVNDIVYDNASDVVWMATSAGIVSFEVN